MQFNINLIAAAILFAPTALAIGPGKCFFGGAFGAGSCHSLDFNGNPTDTFSDCPVSKCSVQIFIKVYSFADNVLLDIQPMHKQSE